MDTWSLKAFLKELYGVGILFFYYMKYIILLGWPTLRYGLTYQSNVIMDILWVYCLVLILKDIVMHLFFKKNSK